ncbi:MAG: hypothetical protein ABI690_21110 [Chloroflexota bacterium]
MDAWQQYLFRNHTEATVRDWARRLQLFRFFRAYGEMNNDSDELIVVFQYQSIDELLAFLKFVGINPVQHTPELASGKTLNPLINDTSWIEQPGKCQIAGQTVFIWCMYGRIRISISEGWEVNEAEVVRAESVEKVLQDAPLPRIEPPVDDKHCLCPKYYREYFE